MDFAESYISQILDSQIGSADREISDFGLYLQWLLSPIRKQSDGSLWPFASRADGLLWIMDVIALFPENLESPVPNEADTEKVHNYIRWCLLADLRYQFDKRDDIAGIEIIIACRKLGLQIPDDVQNWMADELKTNNGKLVKPRHLQYRETQDKIRAISTELHTLTTLFPKLGVDAAKGVITSRYKQHGISVSSDTIDSYRYRKDNKLAISASWLLKNGSANSKADAPLLSVWQKIWIERYPEEVRSLLKNSI